MLNYKLTESTSSQGNPNTLVIVHGLFGAMDNWNSQIKQLSSSFHVLAVDARNHGQSPHQEGMAYADLAADLYELAQVQNLSAFHLMGHSMGGKIAMQFALDYPQLLKSLVVADIAPVTYPARHDSVFAGLNAVPLADIKSRKQADEYLAQHIHELGVRAFLLKNLVRAENGYAWRMNLAAIERGYDEICAAPVTTEGSQFDGPTLFIKGENSDYILPKYQADVQKLFSQVSVRVIADAGHWLHAEKPDMFNRIVSRFCLSHG